MKNNLGHNIARRLQQIGKTQTLVAEESGMSSVMLHKLITGKSNSTGKLVALAKALQCTSEQLVTGEFEDATTQPNVAGPIQTRKVPVITWKSAGELCKNPDTLPGTVADQLIDCPFPHSDRAYCLVIEGLSMFPHYRDGEYILIEPTVQPEHGDDVVVQMPGGTQTFRQYHVTPDGPYLIACNPDFPDRIIRMPEGAHVCGVVTGSWINRRKRK